MKFNVAIDGPSAAGKSTIAELIADKYNLIKIDTGAMYRCVGYLINEKNIDVNDEAAVLTVFNDFDMDIKVDGTILLNNIVMNEKIRNDKISMLASTVSKHLKVREKLVSLQQEIAKNKGYILEGRDIGTVVLKDALVKIYLEADVNIRAKRRYNEYIDKNMQVDFKSIEDDIKKRDYQDINREHSPLKKADDAVAVDVSYLTIDEVVEKISNIIDKKLGE
ncbi:MAG: (d)CMP kinase [Erysipelothrix sp.]|nr:(d)CMP kinase [Erysipelothrix sp.]